ncbi:hypothetical protein C2845_PM03G19850 [Panicum miliaceum]|uniref:Uncharacterized protein n=1 Tax=Panicum miliaceum TaxID=4540 RepID=A0A3L6TCH2_PANMI|nr:hypothetical protein C2845_PM03G19850 [Panicum miliaceum]
MVFRQLWQICMIGAAAVAAGDEESRGRTRGDAPESVPAGQVSPAPLPAATWVGATLFVGLCGIDELREVQGETAFYLQPISLVTYVDGMLLDQQAFWSSSLPSGTNTAFFLG